MNKLQKGVNSMEQELAQSAKEVKKQIKINLIKKGMTQVRLADVIDESPVQLNRAINGDMSPKSVSIRLKVYKVLGMK